jgi:hypothetical protein
MENNMENYYGLSLAESNVVKYSGSLKEQDLYGSDICDIIQSILKELPSTHFLVVPEMGLLILIRPDDDFSALHFKSPMTKADTTKFLNFIITNTKKKTKMVEKFGAIEVFDQNTSSAAPRIKNVEKTVNDKPKESMGKRVLEIILGAILAVAGVGITFASMTGQDMGNMNPLIPLVLVVIGGVLLYRGFSGKG